MSTVWNSADKSAAIALSGGDLTATASSGGNSGVRSTNPVGVASGRKVFFSFTALNLTNSDDHVGVTGETWTLGDSAGYSGVVFQYGGSTAFAAGGDPGGFSPSGKIVDVALDTVARKIWFREDGGDWNKNPSANPATGAGANSWSDPATVIVPHFFNYYIAARLRSTGDYATINTTGPFTYSVPAGFEPWDASVPTPVELAVDFFDESVLTANETLGPSAHQFDATFSDESIFTASMELSGGPLELAVSFKDESAFNAYMGGKPPPPIQTVVIVTGR